MLESYYENKLRLAVKKIGGECWKFESPGSSGVPDRLILLPGGIVAFAETKAPGKKERKLQEYRHGVLRRMGFTVYNTVDSLEKIAAIAADCKRMIDDAETL